MSDELPKISTSSKRSFNHDMEGLYAVFRRQSADIDLAIVGLKKLKEDNEFSRVIAEEIHKTVLPMLPETKELPKKEIPNEV